MIYLYLTDDFSNNSLTIYDETGYNTFNKLQHNHLLSDQLTTNMEFSDTSNNIILDKENTNYLNFKENNIDPRFKQSFIAVWTPGNSQDLKLVRRAPNMKISLPYTRNNNADRNYSITLSSLILCISEQAGNDLEQDIIIGVLLIFKGNYSGLVIIHIMMKLLIYEDILVIHLQNIP